MENDAGTDVKSHQITNRINWSQYGLSETPAYPLSPQLSKKSQYLYTTTENREEIKELFDEDQEAHDTDQEPWWKSSFFVTSRLLFGTWDGVFTTCVMNMVGVVIFLRSGWMVGFAGIGLSLVIVLIAFLIALATVMSAVGICHRCDIEKGGVYFIITHVLGGKIGGAIGLLYCFGHATATALYCTGFAESLVGLLEWTNAWAIRSVSIITLVILLGIAYSGVKWIIRFQLILIAILFVAVFDFIIGTLVQVKPADGFTGFKNYNFNENLGSGFTTDTTFFVVFGVFFPTACGVLAGVNMSGDLKEPKESIPEGSLASIGLCGFLYTVIILFLGSTCARDTLKTDYMIMEKVSLVGALFLFGLFVASLSSSLGGLVGPPRVLQCIAEHDVLPILKPFKKLSGSNREPTNATIFIALVALLFIFIGNLNAIAPIVTMLFLTTYTTINYAYFAMAMSYDIQKDKYKIETSNNNHGKCNGEVQQLLEEYDSKIALSKNYESINGIVNTAVVNNDIDSVNNNNIENNTSENANEKNESNDIVQNETRNIRKKDIIYAKDEENEVDRFGDLPDTKIEPNNMNDSSSIIDNIKKETTESKQKMPRQDSYQHLEWIQEKPSNELYAKLCNRWVSLFTAFLCLLLSFLINWVYAIINVSLTLLLYVFISHARPGLSPGISNDFNFGQWLYNVVSGNTNGHETQEHVVVQNGIPHGISMFQVSENNMDYDHRDRKHHAALTQSTVPYDYD